MLPGENFVADQMEVADPEAIHLVRAAPAPPDRARTAATRCAPHTRGWRTPAPTRPTARSIGRRALRNACLAYLAAAGEDGLRRAQAQFDAGANMTDVLAALSLLADAEERGDAALAAFHARWREDELVLDKWFSIQAMSPRAGTAAQVRGLQQHPDFGLRNPNRVRSLIGAFASGNPVAFPRRLGRGLPLPRRCGDRAGPDQRLHRGAAGLAARPVAAPGAAARRLHAAGAGTRPGHAEAEQGHLREGVEGPGLTAPPLFVGGNRRGRDAALWRRFGLSRRGGAPPAPRDPAEPPEGQSSRMLLAWITSRNASRCCLRWAANAAVPSGCGSTPVAASRSFTSCVAVALAHSAASRSTIGCGVPLGTR